MGIGGTEKPAEEVGSQCTKVIVPLGCSQPDEQITEIAMEKHLATDSTRRGALFINPGSPGYSGVEMVENNETESSLTPNQVYDITGFSPCGVGVSTPITYDDGAGQQPVRAAQEGISVNGSQPGSLVTDVVGDGPTSFWDAENPVTDGRVGANIAFPTLIEETSKDFKREEANCAAYTKPTRLPGHVDTVLVARDFDTLRALSGDQKFNYLGFSYGTYLGTHYAKFFPINTGHMVFDGTVDPLLLLGGRAPGQVQDFGTVLRTYVQQCQSGQAVQESQSCLLTSDVDTEVQQIRILISSTDQAPLEALDPNVTVNGSMIRSVVCRFLYTFEYQPLPICTPDQVIIQKDGSYIQVLYGEVVTGGSVPTFCVINCLDIPARGDMISREKECQQIFQSSLTFGAFLGNQDVRCQARGHNGTHKPAPIHAKGVAPILVVGIVGNPATSYAWSQVLADQLESGRFLAWGGNDHTVYGRSGACVQKAVDTHLTSGTIPEEELACKNGQ